MSEPTYGSGQYDPQGYGGQQQYGGQPYGTQQQPYPTGQQAQQPGYGGGYGQPGGYPSGSHPAQPPAGPKTPPDKLALAATVLTIVGYVCAGIGVLGFVLWLAVDGDGLAKFVNGLLLLAIGLGLGGINYALGTWLGRQQGSGTR